ncbi:MAG: DUF3570 domain-containing protein [Candidatus Eisenbacteria bacterium]
MQLTSADSMTSALPLARRLYAAACLLLASSAAAPVAAAAAPAPMPVPANATRTRFDVSGLVYAEQARTTVAEPLARITRLFPDGQTLSMQFALDVMTGASPTGANPSGVAQTTTSASGTTKTVGADAIPTETFKDMRGAVDLAYERPLGRWTPAGSVHFSREKDYQSYGGGAKLSVDLDERRSTFTLGGGANRDRVFPQGGIRRGLSSSTRSIAEAGDKHVRTGLLGTSRVLTRRWLAAVNVSRTWEDGFLTEPYKVVSIVNRTTGLTTSELNEHRPDTRLRTSVLVNSNYHLTQDVLYASYRYYWDDWDIRSHTIDLRYRVEQGPDSWLEPHVRVYSQSAAEFYHAGLRSGDPLPAYASADRRLGESRTLTLGATYGFKLPGQLGEFTLRGEYMGQFGKGHPADAVGVQRGFDLAPALNVGSIVLGWSFER